jgi:hypoxanthine phosphoribosyltransferase
VAAAAPARARGLSLVRIPHQAALPLGRAGEKCGLAVSPVSVRGGYPGAVLDTAKLRIDVLIPADRVRARIRELAADLARDFAHTPFELLCIDEGATRFTEALVGKLERHGMRPRVQRVRARRSRGMRLEAVQVDAFDPHAFEGRDVLVVDDIADEGATLRAVMELLAAGEPRSVRSAVLVDKAEQRTDRLQLDYVGFRVERGWVVGFGMDLDGAYRELDFIGVAVDPRFS